MSIPAEYFGLLTSSHVEKSKENSRFKYNELFYKNNINNLKNNSIVKCDFLYTIPASSIGHKIGIVDNEDLKRFASAYKRSRMDL